MSNQNQEPKGPNSPFASRNDRNNDTEEDQPTMRSVAIAPSRTSSAPFARANGGGSFGISKPPLGLSSTRPDMKRKMSLSMQKEWTGEVAVPAKWNVKPENLEMVPQDFPLERTNREIHDCDATEVASRITQALKQLSICAEFDSEKARAKCRTQDYVSFRIRLYAGGISGEPVIVEVQRRSGDAMGFMQSCRSILCAAEGKGGQSNKKKGPPFMMKPLCEMKCLQNANVPHAGYVQCAMDALDKVVELLRKKEKDLVLLGLQNLIGLTDPIKTAPKSAIYAAKCVVLDGEKHCLRQDIGTVFVRASEAEREDDDEEEEEQAENIDAMTRSLCLKAFANALSLTSQHGDLAEPAEKEPWFNEILVPLLLEEVKEAVVNPSNAYIAACCLHSLLCSEYIRSTLRTNTATLKQAHEAGLELHELLEREVGRCLEKLEG